MIPILFYWSDTRIFTTNDILYSENLFHQNFFQQILNKIWPLAKFKNVKFYLTGVRIDLILNVELQCSYFVLQGSNLYKAAKILK